MKKMAAVLLVLAVLGVCAASAFAGPTPSDAPTVTVTFLRR